MEVCSTDLPSGFHPTMSVGFDGNVVATDGVYTKSFRLCVNTYGHYFRQEGPNLNVGNVTSIHYDQRTKLVLFGRADGKFAMCRRDLGLYTITINDIGIDTPVTACIPNYVAHGSDVRKVGSLLTVHIYGDHLLDIDRSAYLGDAPVTLISNRGSVLFCFAGNQIFQFDRYDFQYFPHILGPTEEGSVLCLAYNKYVVYPTGIYLLASYDGEKFTDLTLIEDFTVGDDDVKAVSACVFGNYVAILFDNRQLSISTEINNRMQHVAEIEVEALGQLCGEKRGHEFTLVRHDKIIRYGLSGQEVSATEDSDSSSDSSDSSEDEGPAPVEEEPSSAAGGRGTKRPASDPHKVKGEVLRLMQHLSKEERIALLKELNSEKCPVCLDEYNNPEDAEKDPVLGECGHTVCKVCEPHLKSPKQCPSCRQKWKPAEFALLLV